jgi:cystathionine beta-synthase
MAAEVAGAVVEKDLLDAIYTGRAKLADRVEQHMSPALPSIGSGSPVSEAVAALEHADALLVQEEGKPVGVVTRQDLLGFITNL